MTHIDITKQKLGDNFIYISNDLKAVTDGFIDENKDLISEEKLEKILSLRNDDDKRRSFMSYFLLHKSLNENFNYTSTIALRYSSAGKPYLADSDKIFFNISHSKNIVGCAVSSKPVGFDIQTIVGFDKSIINRICSDSQIKLLNESNNLEEDFIKLWTQKESIVKLTGQGISGLKAAVPEDYKISTFKCENYFYSVCNY